MSGCTGEGSSQPEPSQFEWELCRENVKPLKTGRRVDAINEALAHTTYGSKAETLANQKFDEIMQKCETADDPMMYCLEFCKWFEQKFPHGRQRLFYSLLWKIAHRYAKCPQYLDDERMLRIWENLADNSLGHGWEIYQHAHSIGSLLRSAHLYIKWAEDLEMRGAIADARAVFRRARKHGALPLEAIDSAEDQLEMREMRRQLDGNQHSDDSWEEDESENGKRAAFTRLRTMDESSAAPVVRLPAIVGEQGSSKLDRGQRKQKPVNNGVPTFQILEDDEEVMESYLEGIYEVNNHIERFSLQDPNAEKWKASKVPIKKLNNCASSFTVYQEDDEKENTDPQTNKVVKKPILMLHKYLIRDMSIELVDILGQIRGRTRKELQLSAGATNRLLLPNQDLHRRSTVNSTTLTFPSESRFAAKTFVITASTGKLVPPKKHKTFSQVGFGREDKARMTKSEWRRQALHMKELRSRN